MAPQTTTSAFVIITDERTKDSQALITVHRVRSSTDSFEQFARRETGLYTVQYCARILVCQSDDRPVVLFCVCVCVTLSLCSRHDIKVCLCMCVFESSFVRTVTEQSSVYAT